jgi:hypothetical protein
VELAWEHGVYPVAQPLRLDYTGLKKRLGEVPGLRKKAPRPAFVELITADPVMVSECVIEFESGTGGKMRVQWKDSAAPDWASLLRAWREAERQAKTTKRGFHGKRLKVRMRQCLLEKSS